MVMSMWWHRFALSIGALALTGTASAEGWQGSVSRGLDVFSAQGDGAALMVICDPERVFGSDNSGVQLILDGDSDVRGVVTFRREDEELAAVSVRGRIAPDDTAWPALLALLAGSGQISIAHGERDFSITLSEPGAFTCRSS